MKIGIFGDSFAAGEGKTSWTSLIKNKFNTEKFSYPGTSLFWSYNNFLNKYQKYDVVIFLVTAPGRLYAPMGICQSICNLFCVENVLKNQHDENDKKYKIIKAAEQYYKYLQSKDFDNFVQLVTLEKIQNLSKSANKKLILIPVMNRSCPENFNGFDYFTNDFNLGKINNYERQHFSIPDTALDLERKGRIQNHLTDENNKILADYLLRIINNEELKISTSDFNLTPNVDPNIYYNMDEIKKL